MKHPTKVFNEGDIIRDDKMDLVARFGKQKFQYLSPEEASRVHQEVVEKAILQGPVQATAVQETQAKPRTAQAPRLEEMSIKDLRQLAADEKINLGSSASKDDMIRVIKAAGRG